MELTGPFNKYIVVKNTIFGLIDGSKTKIDCAVWGEVSDDLNVNESVWSAAL